MQANRSHNRTRAIFWIRDYCLVVVSVVAAALARLPLVFYLDSHAVFITFFPAIAAAWIAGWGGGLFAIALSTLVADYFFLSPIHSLAIRTPEDQISLAVFILVGLGVSAISQSQRRSRLQAETALRREAVLNRLSFAIRQ